ncbi:MAG: serine--tRNA ligase [Candidatus Pacebacteria bacterium]|nr:serine--tRNA ligase [Candidatus Paceibacterota bacterium]MDD4874861.1 serine--tRNA ligase [Candidatus Paceibacterota bacterium]
MLDIKFIRQNPEAVKEGCKKKNYHCDVDKLLEIDQKKIKIQQELEAIAAEKNKASKAIPQAKDQSERENIINAMKALDQHVGELEKKAKEMEEEFDEIMLSIPNIPFEDVPVGKDDSENVSIKQVGEKTKFDFESKDYLSIAEELDLIDVKRAAKISGSRFGFIKNEAAWLEFAIVRLVFDITTKKGFQPIIPPVMIKPEMALGMGFLEKLEGDPEAYYLQQDNQYLIATAEQPLGAMHADEVFKDSELPRRYLGFSTCFRREAGSYGKDTKGILRVHQFDKLEMFSFARPEDSKAEHELLLGLEEELMQALKIPYQVLKICTGDLGRPAAAKYDIEAWVPSENKYRETHSTSNCTDFQSRRLNIRYQDKNGKMNFVHTLNGTAFAIGRIIIAIIENCQQADGSILVPEVLHKYLPFTVIKKQS